MQRESRTHYILPSNISIIPNANGSFNDLAVNIASGAKMKVYSPRAGIDREGTDYQEWALTGRNRRLADAESKYTIYARLPKVSSGIPRESLPGYLVFAKQDQRDGVWYDKYCYVTPDGLFPQLSESHPEGCRVIDYENWWVKLGEVSLPVNGQRTVTLDTGILGTELYNNEWAVNPDTLPLRIELGCTISDEDAGPTPYVYWDERLTLTAVLNEGWTGTDIQRFRHWSIERNSGDAELDDVWNHPDGAGSYRGMPDGSITLYHPRDGHDDFNGAVSALFTVTAWGVSADDPDSETLVRMEVAQINILAETVEQYELILSSSVVGYSPQTGEYTPEGVTITVRATDQRGEDRDMTKRQINAARLSASFAPVDSSVWTALSFSGLDDEIATATIGELILGRQKSLNVRLLNADNKELNRKTIAFVRDGEDSREREWIFLRSQTTITFGNADSEHPLPSLINSGEVNPSGAAQDVTTEKDQNGWVPEGWYDEQHGTDSDYPYEYGSYRDYVRESEGGQEGGHWGEFSDPKIWNHYGKDGELYVVNTNIDTITIPADVTSAQATIVAAFTKTTGTDGPQAFPCHYAAYRRHGDIYTRFDTSSAIKVNGATFTDLTVSSDIQSQDCCESVVIFISNSPLSDAVFQNVPPSAYLAKKEIVVIKSGDTGPKGEDAYSVEITPEYAIFDETMNGDTAVVDTSSWVGKVRVMKGSTPQRFLLEYGQHSHCSPGAGSTEGGTFATEAILKFSLIKDVDNGYAADGYLLLNVTTDDDAFVSEIKVSYHANLLGNFKKSAARWFLSKEWDDQAAGNIGFLKGLWVGIKGLYEITADGIAKFRSLFVEDVASKRMEVDDIRSSNYTGSDSFAGTGWQLTNNYGNGRSRLVVDDAVFRGKVTLNALEVRKLMAMGGNYVFSPAASVIEQVDYYGYILTPGEEPTIGLLGYEYVKVPWVLRLIPLSLRGRYLSKKKWVRSTMSQEDYSRVVFYRCWLKADDGSTQTINTWKEGMLARCQTFDTSQIENGDHAGKYDSPDSGLHGKDVTNKLYWRAVTATAQGVDKDSYQGKSAVLDDGRKHNYIDLSNTSQDGVQLFLSGSDHVSAGDHIVCYGDWKDANLSHFVTIETIGDDAPAVKEFRGVGYTDGTSIDWSLNNKCKTKISPVAGNDFYAPHFYVETEGSVRDVATFMVSTDGILAEVKAVQSNGKNLLSGVMTGNGWKSGTYEDGIFEYDDDADFDSNGEWISPAEGDTLIVSPEIVITKRHYYTASAYIEGSQTVRVAIIQVGHSPELKSVTGTGRVHATTELTAGTYRIVVEASKIRHAQVELADNIDFAPTAFETSSTEVSSRIKQTADGINASVTDLANTTQTALNLKANSADLTTMRNGLETAGVHLDGNNSKIKAVANHFEIQNSNGVKTFDIDADGNIQGSGNAAFKGTIKNGQYTESGQTKFVNEITPDNGGHLAKGNISWDANGNTTFKGNGQFNGIIVTPFRSANSLWADITKGGSIKITDQQQAAQGINLPIDKSLDGAEVDIVNMTSANATIGATITNSFLFGSHEVTGIVIRSTSLVCRLKAICEDPENDDYVKWMIMNQTDFRMVLNDDGTTYHAESYDCLNDSIKFNNMVSFGGPVCFPGTILGGSPAIGVRGEEAHGEMILWIAAANNTIDFGSQYVRLNTGATQHTFTSQINRAYMFVYNYYDSWLTIQGVWYQL